MILLKQHGLGNPVVVVITGMMYRWSVACGPVETRGTGDIEQMSLLVQKED